MSFKLYWNPTCPFVHRTLIALEEKNATDRVEKVYIPLDTDAPEWYKAINDKETVPTLEVSPGQHVFESLFIAEFIDQTFGEPNVLLPKKPAVRAAIRQFMEGPASDLIGALYGVFFADDREAAKAKARKAAAAAELALTKQSAHGPYFLGEQFSLADVSIVPFLDRFRATLPALRAFEPFEGCPRLAALIRAADQRPSVQKTSLPPLRYVRAYASYGGTTADTVKEAPFKIRAESGSPFAQRIAVAAAAAGVPFEVEYVAAGSGEQLPVVKRGDVEVRDSTPGLLYVLEDSEKGSALLPAEPFAYARAEFVAGEANAIAEALFNHSKNPTVDTQSELESALARFEKLVGQEGYSVGSTFSFADAVVAPYLNLVPSAVLSEATYPKLVALLRKTQSISGVAEALAANDAAKFASWVKAQS